MYESDQEEEGVNLDVVRRQEQPREEIRVYMDPPIEWMNERTFYYIF